MLLTSRFAKACLAAMLSAGMALPQEPEPHHHEASAPQTPETPVHDHAHMNHGTSTGAAVSLMDQAMGAGGQSGWYSSGTSQVPRSTPMYMLSHNYGGWLFLLSGTGYGVFTNQTGERGREKLFSTNWFMPMASRRMGPGTLTLRTMFTAEPLTITNQRYPLLFQTGETAHGVPILNGQHPHDFIMELAAAYQIRLGERTTLNFYGGPRGEPALGPAAFPHRITASENPVAVLSHHMQDSTHISASVVTAGVTYRFLTLEASGFHGREPDEKRWGMEVGAIDSFAARITLTPTQRWSGQFSMGRINNREVTHPLRDTLRSTASLTYVKPLRNGHWATTVVWGRNNDLAYTALPGTPVAPPGVQVSLSLDPVLRPRHIVSVPTREPGQVYNSYLAESTAKLGRNWIWGRVENVDKDSTLLYPETSLVLLVDERRYARVQAYTGGYEREVPSPAAWLSTGIGGQLTIYNATEQFAPAYGSHPLGMQFFLRFRLRSGS